MISNCKDFIDEVVGNKLICFFYYHIHRFSDLSGRGHLILRFGGPAGSDKMIEADSSNAEIVSHVENGFNMSSILFCNCKAQSGFDADFLTVFYSLNSSIETAIGTAEIIVAVIS